MTSQTMETFLVSSVIALDFGVTIRPSRVRRCPLSFWEEVLLSPDSVSPFCALFGAVNLDDRDVDHGHYRPGQQVASWQTCARNPAMPPP